MQCRARASLKQVVHVNTVSSTTGIARVTSASAVVIHLFIFFLLFFPLPSSPPLKVQSHIVPDAIYSANISLCFFDCDAPRCPPKLCGRISLPHAVSPRPCAWLPWSDGCAPFACDESRIACLRNKYVRRQKGGES